METILVVDDDCIILGLVQVYLEDQGYQVVTSKEGHDIINKCKKEKPDIILLDIWLPDTHAFDLIKILKIHEDTRMIPVILISSENNSTMIGQALDLGADDYVAKPIDFIILHARIQAAIRHYRQTKELQKLKAEVAAYKECLAKTVK